MPGAAPPMPSSTSTGTVHPQRFDRVRGVADRGVQGLAGTLWRGVGLVLRVPEREADRDEPLLHTVVQGALDPAAFRVGGRGASRA